MSNTPIVSVSCLSFNHANYIRKCLDSILMQKTTFPIEIVVHDDASTDETRKIVEGYALSHPDIIFPLFQAENQYSKGVKGIMATFNLPRCRGKYVALCEGDDYWTDENKLQRQVEFLEAHEDYSAIAENSTVINSIEKTSYLFSEDKERDVFVEEMVKKRRFATASVMFRKSYVLNILNEVNYVYDTMLWCYLATKGKFRYVPIVSSVYNRGMQGVVESTEVLKWAENVENWNNELIRVFSPKYFSKKYAIQHIWAHYWKAYILLKRRSQNDRALFALNKCYSYKFMKTLLELIMYKFISSLSTLNKKNH